MNARTAPCRTRPLDAYSHTGSTETVPVEDPGDPIQPSRRTPNSASASAPAYGVGAGGTDSPPTNNTHFEDLAQLRTLRTLRATRITAKSIRESVEAMRKAAGMTNPLVEASAVGRGSARLARLSFRYSGALVDPLTRQLSRSTSTHRRSGSCAWWAVSGSATAGQADVQGDVPARGAVGGRCRDAAPGGGAVSRDPG